jgi:uncharacterized membrane protein
MGLGAGVMYLVDPRSGRWRRAHVQGKAVHAAHEAGDAAQLVVRDVAHRAKGVLFELFGRLRRGAVDDAKLEARVRAALGRVCSHPHSVRVRCSGRRVVLEGVVLSSEMKRVLASVRGVRGVRQVDNLLQEQRQPGSNPNLQGGVPRPGERPEFLQRHWSPATRFYGGVVGAGLAVFGLSRRNSVGAVVGLGGVLLALRGLTNLELRRLTGIGAGRRALSFHKVLHVNAPLEEVFAFWQRMENFPRFMSHVEEVRRVSEDLYHWRVTGPARTSVQWDAVVTQLLPNQLLAWKSVEGATIENAGLIRFEPVPGGGTRLDIRLSYNPPAGAIGHAFAKLMGADPKKQMDDDLLRFKSLLERGKTTGHEKVTRDQLLSSIRGSDRFIH